MRQYREAVKLNWAMGDEQRLAAIEYNHKMLEDEVAENRMYPKTSSAQFEFERDMLEALLAASADDAEELDYDNIPDSTPRRLTLYK